MSDDNKKDGSELAAPNGSANVVGQGLWWCNSHGREATHTNKRGERCCDPKLGGILLPCRAIFAPIEYVDGRRLVVNPAWLNASHEYRDGVFYPRAGDSPNDTLCRPAGDAGGAQGNQSKSL